MHVRTTTAAGIAVLAALATASSAAAAHKPDRVTTEVTGTTLAITGTDGGDAIRLGVLHDELRVAVRGRDPRIPLADFDRVTVAPGPGEDRIEVGDLGGAAFEGVESDLGTDGDADEVTVTGSPDRDFASLSHFGATTFVLGLPTFSTVVNADAGDALTLDTASGDDDVSAQSYPAEGLALTLEGGAGDDALAAGRGDDLVRGGAGDDFASGGRGADRARLGTGDDLFRWDPGDGSDAVAFQSGFDALTFVGESAAETFDVQAEGSDVRLTRDLGSIVMELGGAERIGAFLNSGGDRVTVGDLSGTGMTGSDWSFGALDGTPDVLRVDGTAGDDDIVVTQGATNPAGTSTSATISGIAASVLVTGVQPDDAVDVHGLGGEDTLDAASVVPGAFALTFAQ